MTSPRPLLSLLTVAALAFAACGDDPGGAPPFVDPPALPTAGVIWINATQNPTIEALKGSVVFVEFGWLH